MYTPSFLEIPKTAAILGHFYYAGKPVAKQAMSQFTMSKKGKNQVAMGSLSIAT